MASFSPSPDGLVGIWIPQDEGLYQGEPQQEVSAPSRAKHQRLHENVSRAGHCVKAVGLGALVGLFHPFTFQNQPLHL